MAATYQIAVIGDWESVMGFRALGLEPKIGYKDMPESLRPKYQYYTKADISKLRSLGFDTPMTPLEEGVRLYVQEYLNTPDPYM